MPTPRLDMQGLTKHFGGTVALDGVDLSVAPGEVHALVGQNGAGKSTLMKILAGAIAPDAGVICIDGAPFAPRNPHHARQQGIAMIYQELALAGHLSVTENILLGAEPSVAGVIRWPEARRRAQAALAQLGDLGIDLDERVSRLSSAAQQMVEIARAAARGARVLVFDEPTSSLTQADVAGLFALIRRLRQQGLAIVYISHFLEEVREISDRFTVLRDGRTVGAGVTSATSTQDIVALMIGRQLDALYPPTRRTPGEVVLTLDGLAGATKPIDASLNLRRGEVLGIAGLIGAGRTELLRAVFGLDPIARGELRVGAYSGAASPARRWLQGVGIVSEDRKNEGLALKMNIADNLTLSQLRGLGPAGTILPARQESATTRWMHALDIKAREAWQRISELSGGNQQKVALARLLHHDVDILLLDEPTRGIDVGSKAQIYALINQLAAGGEGRPPRAVLMVSSYFPELLGVCDRIAVMCKGRITALRLREAWTEHDLMLAATGQAA